MLDIKTIGVLAYHRCSESDTIIPWEILTGVALYANQKFNRKIEVKLVALEDALVDGLIEMQMGARVQPHAILKDGDLYDMLYVPGGHGSGVATKNQHVLGVIKNHHDNGRFIAANCVGVGILQRAGVLGKTPVTCSPPVSRRLKEEGANVVFPRTMWLGSPEDRMWTTAGASAINAGTVAMVNYIFGEEIGREMAMWFDTLGLVGNELFNLKGHQYYFYPEAEAALQAEQADILLPPLGT
jgi:putative intracellular protease/amidase